MPGEGGKMKAAYKELIKAPEIIHKCTFAANLAGGRGQGRQSRQLPAPPLPGEEAGSGGVWARAASSPLPSVASAELPHQTAGRAIFFVL
ncbi:unnamed protein product [Bubo scandiacus]